MSKNIVLITTAETLEDYEGYAVDLDASGNAQLVDAATDKPAGVVVSGAASGSDASVALPGSYNIPVKLSGTVKAFQYGKVAADGTFVVSAFATGDILCVQFLEAGVSGDLVPAQIIPATKCP